MKIADSRSKAHFKRLYDLCLSRVRATPKKANDLDQAGDDVEQLIMNSSEELQPANWQIDVLSRAVGQS